MCAGVRCHAVQNSIKIFNFKPVCAVHGAPLLVEFETTVLDHPKVPARIYFNPFKTNFSLTFSKKNEYIFLSYVSIEELFRK